MKLSLVAMTRHGIALAARLAAAFPESVLHVPEKFRTQAESLSAQVLAYEGKLGDQVPALFEAGEPIVFVVSLGAVVRLIAPHLHSKESDPAILVVDEAGRFVIPVLSGHQGGANHLAGEVARVLSATPVLTTASDARATLAVDLLGRELGWRVEADHDTLVRCSAAMVNEEAVALVQETGSTDWWRHHANGRSGPLPGNLHALPNLSALTDSLDEYAAVLWISHRPMPEALARRLAGRWVHYRPPEEAQ